MFGSTPGIRTLTVLGLSQFPLPIGIERHRMLVELDGFEPTTYKVQTCCSPNWSYNPTDGDLIAVPSPAYIPEPS